MFKKSIGYVQELDLLGLVVAYNYLTGEITLLQDFEDGTQETVIINTNETEVTLLEELFNLGELTVFEKDILTIKQEIAEEIGETTLFRAEKAEDGFIQIVRLDEKLQDVSVGEKFKSTDEDTVESLSSVLNLVANFHEIVLEEEEVVEEVVDLDFNIKVAKLDNKYFYVCNNKVTGQIDLIKVVFVGHHLLKEEEYERGTLSYEDYKIAILTKALTLVEPNELAKLAFGSLEESDSSDYEVDEEYYEDEEDEEENKCKRCGNPTCYCELW